MKVIYSNTAGKIDYEKGIITIDPIRISGVSDVDGASSTRIRITAAPASKDIVPLRNQVLEIDKVNTTVDGRVDSLVTTTTSGGVTTTTVTTTSVTPTAVQGTPGISAY